MEIKVEVKDFGNKAQFLSECSDRFDAARMEQETDHEAIGAAVNAVFDENPGIRLGADALRSFTLVKLGAAPATYGKLKERFDEYLAANKGERGAALYGTAKGAKGGVWRWADVPADAK